MARAAAEAGRRIGALLDELGTPGEARLEAAAGRCCVVVRLPGP